MNKFSLLLGIHCSKGQTLSARIVQLKWQNMKPDKVKIQLKSNQTSKHQTKNFNPKKTESQTLQETDNKLN